MPLRVVRSGVIAGLIAGVLISAFSTVAAAAAGGQSLDAALVSLLQFTAAGALGRTAFTSPSFAWVGAVVHFVVSIAWATGFAYVAESRPETFARPLVSGLTFGCVVWLCMQLALIPSGLFVFPTPASLSLGLTAYCIFFGLPIAYVNARLNARRDADARAA